jgi:hypothetical protein
MDIIEVATISDERDSSISGVRLTALQLTQQLVISQEYVSYWTKRGIVTLVPDPNIVEN